ncbi:restriction endonuclease subunit S [Microcoleus vaginatus]|uniref:restriction endonuclease subunit S n=1 Tax=Microcoleus vaginatus TaxID=119532 RepID=UPI001F602EBE|nr:restriction endonuclease subunit S [Microcoleus vaginatus HSN003]
METNIPEGYQQTDAGVIPDDWITKKLGDIGKFKNGINKAKEEFGFGYPFVNLLDIFSGASLSNKSSLGLVNSTQQERSEYDLKKGDVLFVRSSVKPEGVGLTSVITEDLKDSVYSGFLIRFRDFDLLNLGYKEYCFYEEGFRKRLIDNSTVSANTNINQDALKSLVVAFPSTIEEQKAIAQALSDADAALAELDRLITKKQNIKQGAMQQLLTGKKRLPSFSGEWEVKKLGEIGQVVTGNTPPTKDPKNYGDEFLFVSPADLGNHKFIINTEKKLSLKGFNLSRKFPKSSILFTCIGSTIGKIGISTIELTSNQQINAIFPNKSYSAHYLYYSLSYSAPIIKASASEQAVPLINKTDFESILIILPSIAEQKAIAQILSDMDVEIEALEQKRDKYKAIKQGMMQELLTGRTRLV